MPDKQEHVRIVMAVYNGALCLLPQLESIAQQSHRNWSILISDDGSTDHSLEIIDAFKHDNPTHQITCVGGPKLGFAQNFVSLLRRAPIDESYLAFSDQDDVWLNDRLARGLEALKLVGPNRPALFCSRTWVTDANLGHRRLSTSRNRPPGFLNALVQNIAAGNTILLNPAARQLVCAASHEVGDLVAHDWWVYQIVSGAGGQVIHDPTPTVLYRQHPSNQIGANDGFLAYVRRIGLVLDKTYRSWNAVNIAALNASIHRLTAENREILKQFCLMREDKLWPSLRRLRQIGLYRQTSASTSILWLAAVLKRL